MQFEWDEKKARQNEIKHGVTFDEAATVLVRTGIVEFYDGERGEDRWVSIGISAKLHVLVVVHTERHKDIIRIISARRATPRERKEYEEGI